MVLWAFLLGCGLYTNLPRKHYKPGVAADCFILSLLLFGTGFGLFELINRDRPEMFDEDLAILSLVYLGTGALLGAIQDFRGDRMPLYIFGVLFEVMCGGIALVGHDKTVRNRRRQRHIDEQIARQAADLRLKDQPDIDLRERLALSCRKARYCLTRRS